MNNAIGTLPPPPPAAANMETSFDLKQLHDALDIPIDEIDDTDLNYIEYINKLFPDESSISNIDSVIDKLNDKIKKIDDQLDNHYRDILEREKMHESMTTNLDKSLVDLMDSIEMTLKQSDESNSLVHNTLHDVMKYNEAKEGLENTSKILSDLLYLIEYSKKLKQLIDSQDFVQISTMLNVFESIYPTLSVLNKYEKVKNILADYNNLRSNLKDILLAKINDDVLKYSFNVSPDNYSAIFSCISSMDEEFQNGIISEILIHFEKELESILSSLLASIDSANFHHTVHDLNHWLGNYIDKILGFNSVGKMPINWHIVHKLCHNFVSQFEMIYEVAAKSDLFETSLPPTFLKIFEAIQALDETIISKMELARTPKSLVVNRIASKNLVAFNKLKFAINQEYADLSKKFNHQCLHDSPGYDGRKLDSDYKLLTITKPFFEFLRDNSSLLQFFPIKSQSLTNICQEFSYLFARLIDSFFAQNFTHCLDFAKLFHSYGNNSATCLSGGVKLPNFETADSGDGVAKSNRALLSLMFASNTQTNRLQFSKFNYSQVPKLLNSLSAKDQSYSPISPTINTANLPTSKLNHSTILQELAALLYVYEFAYDTIDSLESFLRMSSEIEYIETISFSSQIDFLIQCIDSTNHAISCIVISECSSMLDAFSTRAWYDESIGSRSDEGDTRQKSSKYVLNLISQLKLIASEVRDLLDSTRSHFITVCKLILMTIQVIFKYSLNLVIPKGGVFQI
ncbi:MAG: Vacuolar protein sorting-associated protein 53, variant 2 [Marteilia pararefringens]